MSLRLMVVRNDFYSLLSIIGVSCLSSFNSLHRKEVMSMTQRARFEADLGVDSFGPPVWLEALWMVPLIVLFLFLGRGPIEF